MKDSDIYNLNKSLYEIHSKDILRAISEINKLYIGFDGDKKVFHHERNRQRNHGRSVEPQKSTRAVIPTSVQNADDLFSKDGIPDHNRAAQCQRRKQ